MILVTGATGNVGRALGAQLAAEGKSVRVTSRDPASATFPAGVEAVRADLDDPSTLPAALAGVEAVFLMGYGDELVQQVQNMVDAATAADVSRIVFLSSASVGQKAPHGIGATHRRAEEAIEASSLGWTFLRPGPFSSNALWWSPALKAGDTVVRHPFGNVAVTPIHPADIAAVAALALGSDDHAGKAYLLTGGEPLTPEEQLAVLAGVLERELAFEAMTVAEAREFLEGMFAEPDDDVIQSTLEELLDDQPPWIRSSGVAEELLGRPTKTFHEWAVENAAAFR